MPRSSCPGPSVLAGAGAVLALLVYLLPLAAALPRPGQGAIDRTHGGVLARHRQALYDAVSDDGPAVRPFVRVFLSACAPAVLAPEARACPRAGDPARRLAAGPASTGRPRSPPAL